MERPKNDERKAGNMKKRLIAFLLILALVGGMIWSIFSYFDFVSHTVFDESTAHLSEIFRQANHTLYNLVSSNWSLSLIHI